MNHVVQQGPVGSARLGFAFAKRSVAGEREARRQLSSLRQARIHPLNESTPQKSISSQMGSRPFKNWFSNRGNVAIGLTTLMRWDNLIDDDRLRCQSRRQIQGATKCGSTVWPFELLIEMTEAHGQRLGEALRVENGPAIITRTLRTADIAVTEIRCDNPLPGMCGPIQREDAFLVTLHLRDSRNREYWEDGRRASVCDLRAGESCLHDLKRDPTALSKAFHSLAFYLPRAALDAIADDASAPRIRDLSYEPGAGVNDVTISGLGSLLLPALSHPNQANQLFLDHVLLAFGAHVAQTYGGMRPMSRPVRGGLAPWQERRAREILRANIKRGVALKVVARECGLSVGHFSNAFRRTLGIAPYKWLIEQRIALSKEKLRADGLSLSDVAIECGFSDQSHLTRIFRQAVGISPGAWRRALKR
jgi:AraC family transcriptional regulator